MQVSSINNNNQNFKALYFVKTMPLFSEAANYVRKDNVKLSKQGFKYKEDCEVPKSIQKKISNIPGIKNLSEKVDTFVHYCEDKYSSIDSNDDVSFFRLWYNDSSDDCTVYKQFSGRGATKHDARENLIKKLEKVLIFK